jgi:hypothetical protein
VLFGFWTGFVGPCVAPQDASPRQAATAMIDI